jgi:DNA modification methylase
MVRNLHDQHQIDGCEKPRERLVKATNPQKIPTEDLISVLLGHGTSKTDVYELSKEVAKFLREKIGQTLCVEDLTQFDGIGQTKALQIIAALELGRRYFRISKSLSDEDWDFADLKITERQYGVHFFHHYTAKFIPQIPAKLIRSLSKGNAIIVDPFMGSGTTLVEAKLLGCHSYGLDTNPLAIKIAKAKTMMVDQRTVDQIDRFLKWLGFQKEDLDPNSLNENDCLLFEGSQLWFRKDVARKIKLIMIELEQYSLEVQNFIEIGLSDLLKGMSNARMDSVVPVLPSEPVYVDRKHYYREVDNLNRNIPVYGRLVSQLRSMRRAILEFNKETDRGLVCEAILADSRSLSSFVKQCNLVVTSPPYWSAQNYESLHMLSFRLFGLKTEDGKEIGRNESSYLQDMKQVFLEIAKVLSGYFALVIGEDEKKKQHEKLFNVAKEIGFVPFETITRRLSNQTSNAKQIKNEFIYIFRI